MPPNQKGHQTCAPMAHPSPLDLSRRGSPSPRVLVRDLLRGTATSQPCRHQRTTPRTGSERALPSSSPPSACFVRSGAFYLTGTSDFCLPASLSTTSERHHEQDQSESCHHTPRWVWVSCFPASCPPSAGYVRQAARAAAVPFARGAPSQLCNMMCGNRLKCLQIANWGPSGGQIGGQICKATWTFLNLRRKQKR